MGCLPSGEDALPVIVSLKTTETEYIYTSPRAVLLTSGIVQREYSNDRVYKHTIQIFFLSDKETESPERPRGLSRIL